MLHKIFQRFSWAGALRVGHWPGRRSTGRRVRNDIPMRAHYFMFLQFVSTMVVLAGEWVGCWWAGGTKLAGVNCEPQHSDQTERMAQQLEAPREGRRTDSAHQKQNNFGVISPAISAMPTASRAGNVEAREERQSLPAFAFDCECQSQISQQ